MSKIVDLSEHVDTGPVLVPLDVPSMMDELCEALPSWPREICQLVDDYRGGYVSCSVYRFWTPRSGYECDACQEYGQSEVVVNTEKRSFGGMFCYACLQQHDIRDTLKDGIIGYNYYAMDTPLKEPHVLFLDDLSGLVAIVAFDFQMMKVLSVAYVNNAENNKTINENVSDPSIRVRLVARAGQIMKSKGNNLFT